jgi:hypothetical protein
MCLNCGLPKLYRFKGWFFEIHRYSGPWPLCKNGDLKKRAGAKFWKMWSEFEKLGHDAEKYKA